MKAMIFAAGLGTRLHPITKDRPKALAPFLDETLLSYNLKRLAQQGVEHFVINLHHFRDKIERYLDDNHDFGLKIDRSPEDILLDTAGGLAHAARHFSGYEGSILLYNVDIITDIELEQLRLHQVDNKLDIALAVRNRKSSRYLLFDKNHLLKAWENRTTGERKPELVFDQIQNGYAFSGIQLISGKVLQHLHANRIYSLIDFYLENMEFLRIGAFVHDTDYWFDCGNPQKLKRAEVFVKRNKE